MSTAAIEQKPGDSVSHCRMRFDAYNILRYNARVLFTKAMAQGIITRQPCRVCESPDGEGHHTDYRNPLLVEWLCHSHHLAAHKGYSHLWQFLGTDSGLATDAIEFDLESLYAVRNQFKNANGAPVGGYASWVDYVHHNSHLSLRSIQRRLAKVYGCDNRKINKRFRRAQ